MEPSISARTERPLGSGARVGLWRFLVTIGIVAVVLAAAAVALARSPLFRVGEIRVEGLTHGSPARIVRLAGLSERDRIFDLDVGLLRSRIERDPWVDRVQIDIQLPSRVTIRITERSAIATVEVRSGRVLVDAEGRIIAPGPRRGLPEIVLPPGWVERLQIARLGEARPWRSISLASMARALAALPPQVRDAVLRVEVVPDSGVELILRDGGRVVYGPAREIAAKARVLDRVLGWARAAEAKIRTINVMVPSAPTVVLGG